MSKLLSKTDSPVFNLPFRRCKPTATAIQFSSGEHASAVTERAAGSNPAGCPMIRFKSISRSSLGGGAFICPAFGGAAASTNCAANTANMALLLFILFAFYVGSVLFVLVAEILGDVAIRHQQLCELNGERFGIDLWIVNGHPYVQMAKIAPMKAFRDVESFATRTTRTVQPTLIVEPHGIHRKRIAFPLTDRISQP